MKIKTLEVAGIGPAIHAMRNPYDSWDKSDTFPGRIGKADKELSERLSNAGTEHCKHLRMIVVWVEIEAPLYWWKEFDTYRAGVEKLSCSTMHTITKKPFVREMFTEYVADSTINDLEKLRKSYLDCQSDEGKREYWQAIIDNLPNGFFQRRTVMLSYAALRQIYNQRRGHKLKEWAMFRDWTKVLPECWMIRGADEKAGD